MVLHLIPPGQFLMGSSELQEGHDEDEVQVAVTLSQGFWIGQYPVTQAQYEAVIGSNPSEFDISPQHPIEEVSYDNALEFCDQLTENERVANRLPSDWKYSLPTEAQWE